MAFLNNQLEQHFLYCFGFNLKKKSCRKRKYLQSRVEYLKEYLATPKICTNLWCTLTSHPFKESCRRSESSLHISLQIRKNVFDTWLRLLQSIHCKDKILASYTPQWQKSAESRAHLPTYTWSKMKWQYYEESRGDSCIRPVKNL